MIAGNADAALDQKEVRLAGFEEDHDVVSLWLAVVDQRHPVGGRRQSDAIDHQVIANQQSVLHGTRRDDEVLAQKREDE